MKEFKNTLRQTFQAEWRQELVYGAISAAGGVLGVVIFLIVLATDNSVETYATLGALLALGIGILVFLIGGSFSMRQDLHLALSMGKTRKYYVPAKYLLLVVTCLECVLIAMVIGWLEESLYVALYPGLSCEINMSFLYERPGLLVGGVLLVAMVILLMGALFARFGVKFIWVLWGIWMVCCLCLPRIIEDTIHAPDSFLGRLGTAFVGFATQLTGLQLVMGVCVLWLIGMAVAFGLLRKQSVTA